MTGIQNFQTFALNNIQASQTVGGTLVRNCATPVYTRDYIKTETTESTEGIVRNCATVNGELDVIKPANIVVKTMPAFLLNLKEVAISKRVVRQNF